VSPGALGRAGGWKGPPEGRKGQLHVLGSPTALALRTKEPRTGAGGARATGGGESADPILFVCESPPGTHTYLGALKPACGAPGPGDGPSYLETQCPTRSSHGGSQVVAATGGVLPDHCLPGQRQRDLKGLWSSRSREPRAASRWGRYAGAGAPGCGCPPCRLPTKGEGQRGQARSFILFPWNLRHAPVASRRRRLLLSLSSRAGVWCQGGGGGLL
jgi:hypothetical protein